MKKFIFSIFLIMIVVIIPNCSKAFDLDNDVIGPGENFIKSGKSGNVALDEKKVQETVMPLARILVAVGTLVITLAVAVMAIKYLISGPDKKAELKGQLVGLAISAVVIYGAVFIWSTMYNIFKDI